MERLISYNKVFFSGVGAIIYYFRLVEDFPRVCFASDISSLQKLIFFFHCITVISWTCSLMLFEIKIPFHISLLERKSVKLV